MSYNVILLPAAEDDYQEILQYFERQFDSQQAIRSFVKDFGEVLLRLEETPTIYGYSRDEGLRQREYRKFLIGRYVALFKIDELRNTVEIYRIFHGTQNYTKRELMRKEKNKTEKRNRLTRSRAKRRQRKKVDNGRRHGWKTRP